MSASLAPLARPQSVRPGEGILVVSRVAGRSVVESLVSTSPLRLMSPRNHGDAAWVYSVNFGGGLVGGDALALRVKVARDATAVLATQSTTKVYRGDQGASQRLDADVEAGALFAAIPDPVVCFAGARFDQSTRIAIAPGGSAIIVEGYTCGRRAHGERWAFDRYASRLEIDRGAVRFVTDAVRLEPRHGDIAWRMGRFDALTTIVAVGPRAAETRQAMLDARSTPAKRARRLVAVSAVGDDAAIARIAGESVEEVAAAVRAILVPLCTALGDDPFARKW